MTRAAALASSYERQAVEASDAGDHALAVTLFARAAVAREAAAREDPTDAAEQLRLARVAYVAAAVAAIDGSENRPARGELN